MANRAMSTFCEVCDVAQVFSQFQVRPSHILGSFASSWGGLVGAEFPGWRPQALLRPFYYGATLPRPSQFHTLS